MYEKRLEIVKLQAIDSDGINVPIPGFIIIDKLKYDNKTIPDKRFSSRVSDTIGEANDFIMSRNING